MNEKPPTPEEIGSSIAGMVRRMDDELYALSEGELTAQWYFCWDERASVAWNLYQFSDMLEIYKRRCRRWEAHHHGSESVVERVRDKYLMPRIKAFQVDLEAHAAPAATPAPRVTPKPTPKRTPWTTRHAALVSDIVVMAWVACAGFVLWWVLK